MSMMSEKRSLALVFLIIILLWIPTINYTETDDSVVYGEIAKSFAIGEGYSANGEPHAHHLPLFPIIATPFSLLVTPMFALRLVSLLLGIFSVITWFYLGKEIFHEKCNGYFVLLILSPMLVLFTLFRGLAESSMIMFSLLSILFILRANKKQKYYYYLSGICFGLAALSRYAGIIIGIVYLLWFFVERKKFNKHFITSIFLGFFIFSLLLIENFIVFGNPIQFLSTFSEVGIVGLPLWFKIPFHFGVFLPSLLLMTGILLIPFIIKGIERDKSLFILLIVFGLLFASLGNLRFRYIVPLIPFVLIIAYNGYLKMNGKWKKLLIIGIILNILITPYFVNGQFKDFTDSVYQTPAQWGQSGFHGQIVNDWINENAPQGATVAVRHYSVWDSYFRKDINMISINDDIPDRAFIIYDDIVSNSEYILPDGAEEVFSTSYPKITIYKITDG